LLSAHAARASQADYTLASPVEETGHGHIYGTDNAQVKEKFTCLETRQGRMGNPKAEEPFPIADCQLPIGRTGCSQIGAK
jgi:hypothetical protein